MTTLKTGLFAALGVVAVTGTAVAQAPDPNDTTADTEPQAPQPTTEVTVPPPETPPPTVVVQPTYEPGYQPQEAEPDMDEGEDMFTRLGFSVSVGGGVDGFTNDTMRTATDDGGSWDVRAAIGTRSPLAFEGSYIGSAQSIEALGLDDDAILVGNGLQGALRLNLTTTYQVQPFVFGGVAWRRYDLTNADINTSAIGDEDNVLEVPMGAGFGWKFTGFLLDVRGEYRWASEENLVPSLNRDADFAKMHRWGVNANIGYEF